MERGLDKIERIKKQIEILHILAVNLVKVAESVPIYWK
jgi:hypothetical protein